MNTGTGVIRRATGLVTGRLGTWGVRRQAVLAAVVTMAVVLVVAGVVLLSVLRSSLLDNARDLALQRRDTVVEQIQEDDSEDLSGDIAGNTTGTMTGNDAGSGTQVTQILGGDGTVVATSDSSVEDALYDGEPLPDGAQYESNQNGLIGLIGLIDVDDYLVVAEGVATPTGDIVVVVGVPTAIERDAVSTVGWFLIAGVPILLALAGGLIWFLVGRALRPVERIRATVAGISHQHLDERVEVPRTRDEIERLASTMNEMLSRLESADAAQRRFITDASHELRSPLATLTSGLDIAVADTSETTWRDTTTMLQTQARRMGYLVEDLLTLAKIDDTGLRFQMEDVDLDDLLHEEIARLRAVSERRVRAHITPVRITGDPNRLAQVIRNLLTNAERHAASTVTMTLTSDDDAGTATLNIDNDGDTIDEADRKRVFERFVRLDASRTRESGGSGLGLAISQEIIRAHAGTITATTNPEAHTRFTVSLPLQTSAHTPELNAQLISGRPPAAAVVQDAHHDTRRTRS